LTLAVLALALSGSASTQTPVGTTCFGLARTQIGFGKKITIVPVEGRPISGKLIKVGPLDSAITVAFWEADQIRQRSLTLSEVAMIKYRKAGKLRVAYPAIGFLAGVSLALFGEYVIFGSGGDCRPFEHWTSRASFWAGLSGIAAGIGLSLIIPSTRVLTCP